MTKTNNELSSILDIIKSGKGITQDQQGLVYNRIMQLINSIKSSFIELARWIYIVKTHQLWQGMGFTTQEEFITHLVEESQITRTDFFEMVRVYGELVIGYDIPEKDIGSMGLRKASLVARAVEDDGKVEEWVGKANTLTYNHLELEIRQARGGIEQPHHKVIAILSAEALVEFLREIMGEVEDKVEVEELFKVILELRKVKIYRDLEMGFAGIEKI